MYCIQYLRELKIYVAQLKSNYPTAFQIYLVTLTPVSNYLFNSY